MSKRISEAPLSAKREKALEPIRPSDGAAKLKPSHKPLEIGLPGGTVLIPVEDVAAYEAHLGRVNRRYDPKSDKERLHVQTIAHIEWTLLRIPTLEMSLFAVGRKRFADLHAEEPAETRAMLIEAEVLLEFQKPLADLYSQENRLNRQHEREVNKLEEIQSARRVAERAASIRSSPTVSLFPKKEKDTRLQ